MCCKKHGRDTKSQSPEEINTPNQGKQEHQHVLKEHITNYIDNDTNTVDDKTEEDNNEYAIDLELHAVLARLVSDYRAIFAIEDELHHGNGSNCLTPHCKYCQS